MKIAYLGIKGLPSKGGAERVVEGIAQWLADRHELTVYCDRRYTPADVHMPGIRLIRVPTLPGKHLRPLSLFVASALHAFFMGDYDLIHIHNAEACFVLPLLRLRYPVVATSHGQAYTRDKWSRVAKFLLQLTDLFFVQFPNILTSVSLPLAQEYREQFRKQVHYIPNGVDDASIVDLEAATRTLQASGVTGEYVLFAAGRMDPTKGCHLFLQAWRQIQQEGLQAVVVGDDSTVPAYSEELRKMADVSVRFIPFIHSKPELMGIVQSARLFVFPSTVEAMSMMLLEAASLGTPIVCSDIPANTSVLPEQALYFRSGDVDDLVEKLRWALSHPEEMKRLGRSAQEWVKARFSWKRIAEQYDQLYQIARRKNEHSLR